MHRTSLFFRLIFPCGLLLGVLLLCICAGSVSIPLSDTLACLWNSLLGKPIPEGIAKSIILSVRLPRVLCVALCGAALSICGACMQGLLRNPLADGSTLGVSAGASLGAVISMAFDIRIPGIPYGGTMVMAMLFAFGSLLLILLLAFSMDRTFSTSSIILIGVIFSMFASSITSLVITFSGEKIRSITFWTLGSLSGSNMTYAGILCLALCLCAGLILLHNRELDALAMGEENAQHIGVSVRRVKLVLLIAVSVLIGICVSTGGTIAFVGLIVPHMTRMLTGPSHRQLLPVSLLFGAIFLLLADLVSRTLLSPIELPIGVITSIVGSVLFLIIFLRSRRRR
ncbi:MAG: iron ABC transporter permease [Clostridia bacterium]|nr:iron ABC transporter permease [Clostridia bacterium]